MRWLDGSWHRAWGHWWYVAFCLDGWVSLGVHIDLRHRRRGDGLTYGPYVDLHLLVFVVSLGLNPAYTGDIEWLSSGVALPKERG